MYSAMNLEERTYGKTNQGIQIGMVTPHKQFVLYNYALISQVRGLVPGKEYWYQGTK